MKAANILTHIDNVEDQIYLKTKAFPVNMRLYRTNPRYTALIDGCCSMIRHFALAKYEDYKQPHGMSGANLAIPFNIIGIVRERGSINADVEIMINPTIIEAKGNHVAKSNCGSIRLEEPIRVERNDYIKVKYFDCYGFEKTKEFISSFGGDTIQHEIDHNNGILITDRQV